MRRRSLVAVSYVVTVHNRYGAGDSPLALALAGVRELLPMNENDWLGLFIRFTRTLDTAVRQRALVGGHTSHHVNCR